jgi:quinol monooxygenase YgiN
VPAIPWQDFGTRDPNGTYVALASYLPLKNFAGLFPLIRYAVQIIQQLGKAEGLLGYSLFARPFSKQFWTLSVWRDEAALQAFVTNSPHIRIMTSLLPYMDKTKFAQWQVKGSDVPLLWDAAIARLNKT